jgi:CheY-like chemotaxis protein
MKRQQTERAQWSVLLAEDNDDHALLIEMALERASRLPVEVHRARNGNEAVELVQHMTPDLILLDLKMPGRTGHEVLETVKADEILRRIPVAVLTSSDRDEDVARSYGLGGNHFITKPEDPAELEVKLRSLLKNLEELPSVRRGTGGLDPTAISAEGPGSLELRTALLWTSVVVVLLALAVFAYALGVF